MLRENDKCIDCLKKALTLAAPDHLISPFLTVSGHFTNSWNRLKSTKTAPGLLKDILDFKYKTAGTAIQQETRLQKKIKNLTGREMAMIRLVMAGNKNKEIAAEMKVAEITVKKALSLIYKSWMCKTVPS